MTELSRFWPVWQPVFWVKLLLVIIASILSLWMCFFIGEKFFFDKLFYQKASYFGYNYYRNKDFEIVKQANQIDKFWLTQRIRDLRFLSDQIKNPTLVNVCGASDQNQIRLRKFTPEKPFTIVVIGDSNTFGMGIPEANRYSITLSRLLNQAVPTKIYNLAEPGNSIEDDYALYLLAKDYLNPDLVVVGILENDLIFNQDKYPNSKWLRSQLVASCPKDIFVSNSAEFGMTSWNEVLDIYEQSFLPLYANPCFLDKISSHMAQDKNLIFFSYFDHQQRFSATTDLPATAKHRGIMMAYKTALEKSGNHVFGHDPSSGDFSYVSPIEGHPSSQANVYFAELIYQKIVETWSNQ